MRISRNGKQIAVLLLGLSLAGCGFGAPPSQPNGKSATLNLSLKTVPTVRSITISPGRASFANCTGGKDDNNTASNSGRLGYPNGICWVGEVDPIGVFPIKVTNTGIASFVYINGSSATPSDSGAAWSLCNVGPSPGATCTGYKHRTPGIDQYIVRDFGPDGSNNTGLTRNAAVRSRIRAAREVLGGTWRIADRGVRADRAVRRHRRRIDELDGEHHLDAGADRRQLTASPPALTRPLR